MIAVILGAFGAHKLKEFISAEDLAIYETGVRYQFYHTFALLVVAILLHINHSSLLNKCGYAFAAGIVLFSGSLYGLSLRNLSEVNLNWLGPITPLGGLFLILGWLLLFVSLKNFNHKNTNS